MAACFAKGCKNLQRLVAPDSGITFHLFPSNEEACYKWLQAIGRQDDNVNWSSKKFICSEHFVDNDFVTVGRKRYLKYNACPVLHISKDGNKECTSKLEQGAKPLFSNVPNTAKSFAELNLLTEVPAFQSQSTFTSSSLVQSTSKISPMRKRKLVVTDQVDIELSPFQTTKFAAEVSGSGGSGSEKRRRLKIEHNYS